MKILMCNSFYYMRGGSERYMFELTRLLEKHGHEVIPFCMQHEKNLPSRYSDYFVSYINFPWILRNKPGLPQMWQVFERLFFSAEARRKIHQLILDTKPDIAHVHGIGREFSPDILNVIKSFNIPIVQTLHDYGLICPNTTFLSNEEVCERCKGGRYYHVLLRRCKRGSLAASSLACLHHYRNRLVRVFERNVDIYISPSQFLKQKMIEHGVKKEIVVIPNFVDPQEFAPAEKTSDYCLFAGRLVQMKGIRTLMQAAELDPSMRILVAGEGELSDEVRQLVGEHHLQNVTLLGFVEPKELAKKLSTAAFAVIPSEWYENYPMSIVESFACAKPVVTSNIGALPELVQDGQNGLLFQPGDAGQLAGQMRYLFDHPDQAVEMGRRGRAKVLAENDPELNYQKIMGIYQGLI